MQSATSFNRRCPSPRYRELVAHYRTMHREGERFQNHPPERTFSGHSLLRHVPAIKQLIDRHAARSLLDYGVGKGIPYQNVRIQLADGRQYPSIQAYWNVARLVCYDPAYEPHSTLPSESFDGVISSDVLEHCPAADLPWIVEEIFSYARRFVFANVACYPAVKRLPTGENAHVTVQPAAWWRDLFAAAAAKAPRVRYVVSLDEVVKRLDGARETRVITFDG